MDFGTGKYSATEGSGFGIGKGWGWKSFEEHGRIGPDCFKRLLIEI